MASSVRLLGVIPLIGALALAGALRTAARAQDHGLSVRITSPLGRTGLPGAVRIVAQVRHAPNAPIGQVRFFVDDQLLQSVEQGPPYAAEWVDDNPFERRKIAVEVSDALGNEARDNIVLEPFEVTEASEVMSVLLEASVEDEKRRFVKNVDASSFKVFEDDVPQALDVVRQEEVGATFALLVDSSTSMARRMDFVQRTAVTLAGYMRPKDRLLIAPFSKTLGSITGPTNDSATILEGIAAIHPTRGTAILDSLTQISRTLAATEGRRAIVLITDGYDEHSSTPFQEALGAVKAAGATLYVVGIGGVAGVSIKGERMLRQLAVESGGRFFFPSRDEQLAEVHDALTDDVHNRYLISYTPRNQKTDGAWRKITVKTSNPRHVVTTRPGYFAPKPPAIRPSIEFTAADSNGRYLDLTSQDLEILENGAPQQVETFQEAVDPVSIVLALDASGSMRKKEAYVIESAREFVRALRPQDNLAVVMFADRSVFAYDLSPNRDFAYDAIGEYRASGGTALYDALSDSAIRLKRATGRRVVVVMTDGRDENNPGTGPGSVRTFDEMMKYVKDSGAMIFTIGLGTKIDQVPLETLARVSGGRSFFPAEAANLSGEFARVVEDLRRHYVIGYTSSNIQRDGSWRKVEIRVKSAPGASVRSADGYFAPAR
jgi:Ca-activated chloride channel family protein